MSGKVIQLGGSALQRTGGTTLSRDGKMVGAKLPFGHVWAVADGTILLRVVGVGNDQRDYELSVDAAREVASAISRAAHACRERREQLDGSTLWIARRGAEGEILVTHRKTARPFRVMRIGRPRRVPELSRHTDITGTSIPWFPARCRACMRGLDVGDRAYCEAAPGSHACPNWRDVRLCAECVESSLAVQPGVREAT